jgi:hypothetical protein
MTQPDLASKLIWYLERMRAEEVTCHRPKGELCAGCRERRRLRRELIDILVETTNVTGEDLKDVL